MKRWLPLVLVLAAVVAFPATAEQGSETASAIAAPTAQPTVQSDDVLFGDQVSLETVLTEDCTQQSLDTAAIIWPGCPYGAPQCKKHDDCDAYCGDPRFGWCFSNGCCGCSG